MLKRRGMSKKFYIIPAYKCLLFQFISYSDHFLFINKKSDFWEDFLRNVFFHKKLSNGLALEVSWNFEFFRSNDFSSSLLFQ